MDSALARILTEAGHLDPDTGAMRTARATHCRTCKRPVIRGFDADVMARSVDVDPAPLSQTGELLALLLGLRTFTLSRYGGRFEVDHRDNWRIKDRPAGSPTWRGDVLALHSCAAPTWPPAAYLPTAWPLTPPRPTSDVPPF